ncbi:hypothetical protein JCM9140_1391 [Halalkalibacter wakoensis JCM 9140]|uniref:NERD domain-containing protein n=1 Tax=Halalkalibacter wakoensis JCM 9140 TaxID=1236970 RepID=W4Q201_9BACI|nr:NERD domain-containing protein [Halalkalibacter wakoensis]GAE25399.1 hypothetical protein JCM9140_1391 [Halalkalibacter wakoensis JCM 9140]
MILKSRNEPVELQVLRSLRLRMRLTNKEESYYLQLDKGYEGEKKFDRWIEPLLADKLLLTDLLLECSNSLFQIDSLLLTSNMIYLFEIKNFEGDFLIEDDKWYTNTKKEIKNPLLQLKRNESLFRRSLQEIGCTFPIESYLIFINPNFHLYQAPTNTSIIFPTQLNRFYFKLSQSPSSLKDSHFKLANQVRSLHLSESPFNRLPVYQYDILKKGIPCPNCKNKFYKIDTRTTVLCHTCGHKEKVESAVLRCIKEFKLLFPKEKITTNTIHEWCEVVPSKKSIRNILFKHFTLTRRGKSAYFI